MLFACFFCKKVVGKVQVDTEFKDLEQVHPIQKFSYGHNIFSEKTSSPGMFSSLDRSQRCVFARTHSSSVADVSAFGVQSSGVVSHFQFRTLPFGHPSSPRIITKIMAGALAPIRLEGVLWYFIWTTAFYLPAQRTC